MSRVVVIGAGTNGLAAAGLIARAGHQVTVIEARDDVGGISAPIEVAPGYVVPGLLHDTSGLRTNLLRRLALERHGLQFEEQAPDIYTADAEGACWLTAAGPTGDVEPGDAERWAGYRDQLRRFGPLATRLLSNPPPDPQGRIWPLAKLGLAVRRLGAHDMGELMRVGPMCVGDWLRDHLKTERLQAALAAPALEASFTGPWSPGSAAPLLLRACAGGPPVAGGPAAVVTALHSAAEAAGAKVRTAVRAQEIQLAGGRAVGVLLADGEALDADAVLSTCDPKQTFLRLIGARRLPTTLVRAVRNIRVRGTTAKVHLALRGPLENKAGEPVTLFRTGGTLDDLERAFDGAKYGALPSAPMLEAWVPTMTRPELAPTDHHVCSVLVHHVPHEISGGNDDARDRLGETVVAALAEHFPKLRQRIEAQQVITPADLERDYHLSGGHLFHGEHALDQLLFLRPIIQCAHYATPVAGLYLGGSGSHPGGGVTCAPGALAAQALLGGMAEASRAT